LLAVELVVQLGLSEGEGSGVHDPHGPLEESVRIVTTTCLEGDVVAGGGLLQLLGEDTVGQPSRQTHHGAVFGASMEGY